MSNEITLQIQLSCRNGEFYQPPLGTPQQIDQANAGGGYPGFVVVGLSQVEVDLSTFTKPGYAYIKLIGEYGTGTGSPVVTYGPKSGGNLVPFGECKEGEEGCFRLTGQYTPTLMLKSTEPDSRVQLVILED